MLGKNIFCIIFGSMRCPNPRYVWPKGKVIAVPCGKCLACLSNRRHDWAFRLMAEYKVSDSAHFVTLTYSEKYVPESGVSKRHLQLYFKRLRKRCPSLRYYAVGEYGSQTLRPHYHAIVFNCNEKAIRDAWTLLNKKSGKVEDIGIVHVGNVTEASVSYTLKYIVQPFEESGSGLSKPFSLMSRGYGLGCHYLTDKMIAWHRENDAVYILKYGEKMRLPRFYKDKIWPDSDWSDWAYRRQTLLKKSQMEAEEKAKKDEEVLKSLGYSPEQAEKFRLAEIARIKTKVAFTQKL